MKTAPPATDPRISLKRCREDVTGTWIYEPKVTLDGARYRVDFGETIPAGRHLVSKNRECSCGTRDCLAIDAVKRYLQDGGRRAPDLEIPALCPICGSTTTPDRRWNGKFTREAGWRCVSGGLAHFLEAKARRIEEQLARNPWLIPPATGYPGLRRDALLTWEECLAVNRKVFLATGYDPTA